MSPFLQISGLDVCIGPHKVCRQLDLQIRSGESWALLGRNGVGKTTLLHHLGGLRRTEGATIRLDGEPLHMLTVRQRARKIGILLQHSSRAFSASVFDTVLSGRHPHLSTLQWERADDLQIAQQAIRLFELEALADRSLDTLSGGELRRVELARLLAQQTPLVLLDEPLNHLDMAHQSNCLRALLDSCVGPQHAAIMVMHDLNLAFQACDHWLILNGDGSWQAGRREDLARRDVLTHAYAHAIERIETANGPVFVSRL